MLLDTNIIIDLFKGNDTALRVMLESQVRLYLPSIVLGELYLGAFRSANTGKHLEQIEAFAGKCFVISVDKETAIEYGRIKGDLLNQGRPIPENDIWIAAISRQHNILTLTGDKHFLHIPGLKVTLR